MSAPIKPQDNISQRITKLLPADITAAVIGIKSAVESTAISEDWVIYGAAVIAVLAPIYFYYVLGTKNPLHILFLMLSFGIFVLAIALTELGNFCPSCRETFQGLNAIVTPIWVFVVTPVVARMLGTQLED